MFAKRPAVSNKASQSCLSDLINGLFILKNTLGIIASAMDAAMSAMLATPEPWCGVPKKSIPTVDCKIDVYSSLRRASMRALRINQPAVCTL
jgi:hypothetical protein